MFPTAEYVLTGELADRRERIANDFARVGRPRRRAHRRHPVARVVHTMHASTHRTGSQTVVAR